jgi:hypothetical protein
MSGAVSAFYEHLIARELDEAAESARALEPEDLYLATARFAVLAYAPSQHAKRAVMAARAVHDLRDELGERWVDLVVECARYVAESRQPWSEPPILDPPAWSERGMLDDLARLAREGDRLGAERWLASRLSDSSLRDELSGACDGDALLMAVTAFALESLLGAKGRFALLRMPIAEIVAEPSSLTWGGPPGPQSPDVHVRRPRPSESRESGGDARLVRTWTSALRDLIDVCIASRGSIESVYDVLLFDARYTPFEKGKPINGATRLEPYRLARDYAQTLIAHAAARRLHSAFPDADVRGFLASVHDNLQNGESFADWSFA